ncbi:MerR family transcriptional regulator [Lacunimicrobium album]|jgi:methionine salvage enolase-phosphatase E1
MEQTLESMSLSEIKQILRNRENQVESLKRRRDKLTAQLQEVEEEIASLEGTMGVERRGVRARNEKSLNEHVQEALKKSKKGLTLNELSEAVKAAGYQSNSLNFKNVLYQNLYNATNISRDENSGKYTLSAS